MIAFWLLPASPQRESLAALIRELAERWDAPVFEPHVTLFAGDLQLAPALDCLSKLTSPSLELEREAVRFSDVFTKTLFVQFHPSAPAGELSAAIQAAVGGSYQFDPHLSLIYKTMSVHEKQQMTSPITLPFDRLSFDRIQVITGPSQTRSADDVNAWRRIAERRLCGGR